MNRTVIKNASIVNEGQITIGDILIQGERIEKIDRVITLPYPTQFTEIDATGKFLLPGVIDAQVHFREPGLTHKADLKTESIAALAGGVTSFMDMPNTIPNTLTQEILEQKYKLASQKSLANYSFFMGVNQHNLDEALRTNSENVCGITDDGLYFNDKHGILANAPDFLNVLFSKAETLIALHCEDDTVIENNLTLYKKQFGDNIPVNYHPKIRTEEACYKASKRVIDIAKKHNTRFHLLHVSTFAETKLLENKLPVNKKRITAETCSHYLWFNENDYKQLGNLIKWNPAIKNDNDKLLSALLNDYLDIITTDHAPHLIVEKEGNYDTAKSGAPLVQHSLLIMLELHNQGKISLEKIAEKMSHNVAEIYKIKHRGFIREGYFADLVLVDLKKKYTVNNQNILYKCSWSPLANTTFNSAVTHTFVNGTLAFYNGKLTTLNKGKRLLFDKIR